MTSVSQNSDKQEYDALLATLRADPKYEMSAGLQGVGQNMNPMIQQSAGYTGATYNSMGRPNPITIETLHHYKDWVDGGRQRLAGPSFMDGVKEMAGVVGPFAVAIGGAGLISSVMAPAAGAVGSSVAAGTTAATTGGFSMPSFGTLATGAVKGAAVSALTGGDPIKGAITGAVSSGFSSALGDFGKSTVGQIATGVGTGFIAKAVSPGTKTLPAVASGVVGATDIPKAFSSFGDFVMPSVFKNLGPSYRGSMTR